MQETERLGMSREEKLMKDIIKYHPTTNKHIREPHIMKVLSLLFDKVGYEKQSTLVIGKMDEDSEVNANCYPETNRICVKDSLFTKIDNYPENLIALWHEGYHLNDLTNEDGEYDRAASRHTALDMSDFDNFMAKVIAGKGIYQGIVSEGDNGYVEVVKKNVKAYKYSKYFLDEAEQNARKYSVEMLQQVIDYADSVKWFSLVAKRNIANMKKVLAKELDHEEDIMNITEGINYSWDGAIKDIAGRVTHFMTAEDEEGLCILDKVAKLDAAEYDAFKAENGNLYEDMLSVLCLVPDEKLARKMMSAIGDANEPQWQDGKNVLRKSAHIMRWDITEEQRLRFWTDWKAEIEQEQEKQ